ncbi:MAG TPA: hypothetical protein VLO09_03640, partial [Ornithinimicrobium sp.]|nr:hypothetical protein [Ornithinimicrobium sp.]
MTQLPRRRRAVAATGATALLASLLVPAAATADGHDAVFISEIHYDNDGSDTGEAIEVQAPVGTDLTGWTVELYNGSGGTSYGTIPLNGTVSDAGVVSVLRSSIQNGSPDGLALVDASGGVVEFLSYEGVLVAVGGPADGQTSTDIGVQEPGDTPVGESLQRVDGIWTGPVSSSFGVRNGAADPGGPGEPDPVDQGACGDEATLIGAVKGSGEVSPMTGATVTVEGTVVGDFQHGGSYRGYYVQDAGDGDVATSD